MERTLQDLANEKIERAWRAIADLESGPWLPALDGLLYLSAVCGSHSPEVRAAKRSIAALPEHRRHAIVACSEVYIAASSPIGRLLWKGEWT